MMFKESETNSLAINCSDFKMLIKNNCDKDYRREILHINNPKSKSAEQTF